MGGGAYAGGVVNVFKAERNAVHRAPVTPGSDFGFGFACLIEGALRRQRNERVDLRVKSFDSLDQCSRQLDWRELAQSDEFARSGNRQEMKCRCHDVSV